MPKALGLVETRGLVAAIEAADAMVKTSNVTLIGKEITRPALVTIKIVGDVAAVKASVDAGAAAAKKVGELVSIHVIPQPDSQMIILLPEIKDEDKRPTGKSRASEKKEIKETEMVSVEEPGLKSSPVKEIQEITEKKQAQKTKTRQIEPEDEKKSASDEDIFSTDHLERLRREALGIKADQKEETKQDKQSAGPKEQLTLEELEKLNVHQLRKQARATDNFPIQGREISRANRNQLLDYFKKLI